MSSLYREEYIINESAMGEIAKIISRHMLTRIEQGRIIIITNDSLTLLRIVRKQWKYLINAVQKERSRTLSKEKIEFLTNTINLMQQLEFTASYENTHPLKDVYFLESNYIFELEFKCTTLYLINANLPEYLLERDGLIVNLRS